MFAMIQAPAQSTRRRWLAPGLALCLAIPPLLTTPAVGGPSGFPSGGAGFEGGIAERELARRVQRLQDAQAAIEEGDRLRAEGDFEGAIEQYREAVRLIPDAPATREWREFAISKLADASVELARQRLSEGRREEARRLLQGVLNVKADHAGAARLLREMDDPERHNPALTEEHVSRVNDVMRNLEMSRAEFELGNFDASDDLANAVLAIDPYNQTARRQMVSNEQARRGYFDASRDHTRERMLREVDELWATRVPMLDLDQVGVGIGPTGPRAEGLITEKLRSITIPTIEFTDATITEAIEYIRQRAQDLDPDPDPNTRGVNIVVQPGAADAAPRISLNVRQVPLGEALRYITDLAGLTYQIDAFAVIVVPPTGLVGTLYTRRYRVPPDFIRSAQMDDGGGPADDPFFQPTQRGPARPPNAQDVLGAQGVVFGEGASAFYDASTSTLVVRNTQAQLDLVEAIVEARTIDEPRQIYITTKFVEVSQRNTDELGFDWLLGPFGVGGGNFATGGTPGNAASGAVQPIDFPFTPPGVGSTPIGRDPLTRGLRFGTDAIRPDNIDGLLAQSAAVSSISPAVFGIAGIFTDPQYQVVMRALSQKRGVDLMTAPSITTRSGQRARIEVIREFIYPTEFDPPELPQQVGSANFGGGGGGGFPDIPLTGQVSSFPVTPTTPTTFEMRPVGVTLDVDATIGPDGFTIDMALRPEVVEFEGFINYGSPIQAGAIDALGQPTTVVLTENRIEQPVFSTRRVETSVTLYDGQTVAIGGLIREDVQTVHDKVPIFGDIPLFGRLFQTKAEEHFKRNLIIFVTAKLIDPTGQPVRRQTSPGAAPAMMPSGPSTPLIP